MKDKKVLFIATVTKHINAFHIPYLKWFKEQGYEVHVASNGDEEIKYCDKHFNLQFERNPLKVNNIKVYKELKSILNENNYEIVHCHTPVGGALTRLAAKKARKNGTRVIYTAHGFHFYKGAPLLSWLVYYPIEKLLAKHTDCLITINTEDYELAKKKFKKCKQIELVHGVGLNTEKFNVEISEEERLQLRNTLGYNKEDILLICVAELNKNKNQLLLINTMEKLVKENQNIHLILVGKGILEEEYKTIVKEKQLEKNIQFLGYRKDIPQLLSISDIGVAASLREGLPVNIMEMMYMGLPVVCIENRGHCELIKENQNGYIIKKQNIDEFVNKIDDAINNVELLRKNGEKMVKKYCIEEVKKEMEKIYKENKYEF